MANDITIINNTTADPQHWRVDYEVDNPGLTIATLNTAGTFVDRNIQIAITTPAGNAEVDGGGLSIGANYSATPNVNVTLDGQTTTGITITDTAPSSGYYVQLTGKTSALSGLTTVNKAATTLTLTSGYIASEYFSGVLTSASISPTVTVSSATKTRYLQLPTATFTIDGSNIYSSAAGWVPAGSAISSIENFSNGELAATTTAITSGTAAVHGNGHFATSGSAISPYYVELVTTAGSVKPVASVVTNGYVTSAQNITGGITSVNVAGNGSKLYIAENTIEGTVYNLNSGTVVINTTVDGIDTTTTTTPYSITVDSTVTCGSVQARAAAGTTTGIVAANELDLSEPSEIFPSVTGETTIYIPAATHTLSGGDLTAAAGSASLSASSGYYNGTSYDNTDMVTLTTTETSGYYKLVASGSGKVTRTAINSSVTSGYTSASTSSIAFLTGTSNVGKANYYIKKSTLSADTVNSSSSTQTLTITSGYYPTNRTVTINAMTTQTPSTNYTNSGMSTYFNTGTSSNYTVSITPNYSNSAGYVAAHTNTNNGGIGYWKIKTTTLNQGTTTVSNNVATRGTASISSSGWIESTSIPAATFSNVATTGTTYVNISNTPDAPILDAEGNLYINKGYVDNLQISLARLIPDDANVASSATMLQGTTAYDKNGKLWTGTIATFTPSTKYYATTSDQTLSTNGKYVSGDIVISKLTSSNYTAANIRKGTTISVNNGSSNVYSVAGTFTSANTVSSGQTAASASQILSGYSAWVDGAEIKGNIAAKTTGNITESFTTTSGLVNIPAGFYAEDSSFVLTNGNYNADSSTSANSTVTPSVTISSASTYGFTSSSLTGTYVTIDPSASATAWSVTPRANITTSGYIPTGSKIGTAVTNTPSIEAGTNWYVPVVTPQFKGGNYTTTNTNVVTTAPTVTIGSTGTFVGNGSTYGITTTIPTGTDGTNYLTISDIVTSTTGSAKSTWTATKAANTYSATYKGVVNIASGTTAIATSTASGTSSVTITPTVTNNFVTYYVPIVTPQFNDGAYTTNTDTNTVTNPSVTVNGTGSLITSASTYGVTTAAIAGTEGTNFVTFDATTTATNGTAVSNWRVTKAAITYGGAYKGLINTTAGDTAVASTTATGTSSTTIIPTVTDNFPKYYMPIVTPTIAGGTPSVNISSNTVTSANMTTATTGTYYITMTAKGTGSRSAITYSNSAGAIIAHSSASGLNAATSTEGSKAGTVYVPTATKTLSLNSNIDGTAAMGATGFTPASSGSYYVTLTTTAGSVVPKLVTTSGYTPAETTTGSSTSVGVTGNGAQIFIPTNTITGSVVNLSSGSVAISKTVTGMATSTAATSYYITVGATVTNGSVKGKATAGNTTGIVAAGATSTSNASTITPGVNGTGTIYIPAAAYTVSGGGLTSGNGNVSVASTDIDLSTTATTGYYKITASGYGTVNRAAITKQVTTSGYIPASAASTYSASTSINSNTATQDYYIKNSTITTATTGNNAGEQTITISSGYYPSDRTLTVGAVGSGTVTPGFNQANITTYFNTTGATTGSISITPKYSNTAGYIDAHTNTLGTTAYYNIKTTSLTQGTTTISGTSATRGSASIANSGWIESTSIPAATFANTASTGITYVDISNTTEAPILASSGYLYINKGYTDNLRISLAHLIPDGATVNSSSQMLNGVTAYDGDGKLWTGNIASMAGDTKYATTSDQTIQTSGKYLTGNIIIKKLTSANYSAANIKKGVTITVGNSSANVYSVTGTFTSAGTQTTGTLAAAGQILSGYTAWANGAEVNGNIVTRTSADLSVNGNTVSVASGYYASNVSASIGAGAYTAAASQVTSGTITPSVSINSASTYGFTTTQPSAGTYLTVDPGASVTTKWKARATATITTSGYLSTGSTTSDYEGTPEIAAGTNYYVPVVTPTITAGTVTPTISNAITVSGMDTTTAATSYYIDAAASGSYTVTSAKYTNTAGVIAAHTNTVVNTGSSGTIANTTASRVYIPAAGINSTGSITNVTTTVAPGAVSIANNTAAVSGKTRIGVTPATTTGSISTYYIALQASAAANSTGVTSAISGTSTASINSAGYAPTTLTTSVALSGSVTAKTSKKDSSVYYVPIPTATFTADGASIKCSTAGWIAANSVAGTIGNGTLKATTAALTSGSAAMTATTNMVTSTTTGTNFGTYYVTLTTTAGSVTPQAGVQTAGYVTTTTTANGTAVSVPVTGNSSKVYIQAGAYSADKSTSTNSTVTPSVAVNNATIYGFTTAKPSGTNGTNYLTIDPGATATNWSVTPRANITRAGYIAAGSGTGTAVSGTPTIAAGTNYYVPIVSPTFSGGDVTAQLDLSTSSFETNMVTTTTSDYYVRVITSGTFQRTAVTYNNSAGVVSATTGGIAAMELIDGYIDQASATIRIPQATMSVTGTNTVSPSVSMTTSNVVLNDTNNGIAVTATGGGTAAVTAVAATNQAGYAPAGAGSLGSATLNAVNNTTSTTKYIAGVTLIPPTSGTRTFSLTIPNGSTSNFMTFVFTTDSNGNVTVDEG